MSFEKADKEFLHRCRTDKAYALTSLYDQAGHDVGALDPDNRELEVTQEWLNPRLSALIGLAEMREATFTLMEEMRSEFDATIASVSSQTNIAVCGAERSDEVAPLRSFIDAKIDPLTPRMRAEAIKTVLRQIMRHPTPFGLPVVVGPCGLPDGDAVASQLRMRIPQQGPIEVQWFDLLEWLALSLGGRAGCEKMRRWAATWLAKRWSLMRSPFEIKNGKLVLSSEASYSDQGLHALAYTFIAMKVFAEYVNTSSKLCPAELRSILAKASIYKGEPGVVFKAGGSLLVRYMKQEVRWTFTAELAEVLREFVADNNDPDLETKVQVFR